MVCPFHDEDVMSIVASRFSHAERSADIRKDTDPLLSLQFTEEYHQEHALRCVVNMVCVVNVPLRGFVCVYARDARTDSHSHAGVKSLKSRSTKQFPKPPTLKSLF